MHGDLLDVKGGIILHQVNNRYKMGSGVAKSIRNKYPKHYDDYMSSDLVLGDIVVTKVGDVIIVGLIAQDGYGRDKCYTDYKHLKDCLLKVKKMFLPKGCYANIYAPYKMSCGLGGGDWKTVSGILESILPDLILVKMV